MAFELKTDYPKGYWYHRSGDEHVYKHLGDIPDVQALLTLAGEASMTEFDMRRLMHAGGVSVVRRLVGDKAAEAVGVLIADRSDPGIIDVKTLYVLEAHRGKGIGGFLLGNLIVQADSYIAGGAEITNLGRELRLGEQTYMLPGHLVEATAEGLKDNLQVLMSVTSRKDWNGVRSVGRGDTDTTEVIRSGQTIAHLTRLDMDRTMIVGADRVYEHIAFAAIAALNDLE